MPHESRSILLWGAAREALGGTGSGMMGRLLRQTARVLPAAKRTIGAVWRASPEVRVEG